MYNGWYTINIKKRRWCMTSTKLSTDGKGFTKKCDCFGQYHKRQSICLMIDLEKEGLNLIFISIKLLLQFLAYQSMLKYWLMCVRGTWKQGLEPIPEYQSKGWINLLGYTSCLIFTIQSTLLLAEFKYNSELDETFPIFQSNESRLMFYLKKDFFPICLLVFHGQRIVGRKGWISFFQRSSTLKFNLIINLQYYLNVYDISKCPALKKQTQGIRHVFTLQRRKQIFSYHQSQNTSKIISPLYSMSNSLFKEPTKYECPNHQQMKAMTLSKYLYGHPPKLDNIMNIYGFEPKLQLEMVKPVIDTNIIQTIQTISEEDLQTINLDQINIQLTQIEQTLQQTDFHQVLATLTNIFEKLSESINYNLENELPYQKHIVYQLRVSVLLSKIYKCMGDYKNSIMWLLKIRQNYRVFDPSLAGKLMLELSKLYFLNLQIRESQGILHEALLHFEKIEWKADIAKTLLLQARICAWMNNFDMATKLVYGAISLLREAYINDETKLDQAYFILAECHYVSKKYDTAKEFLVKVIQLNLQTGKQEDHITFLEIYNLLGLIHAQIFDLKTSYFYFCQAYKCINSNNIQKGQILNNISLIQKFLGQLELADRCQKAATEIYAQFLQENHQIFKRLLLNSIIESQQ